MNSKSKKIRYIITVMALAGLIGNPMLEGATVVAITLPTESEVSEESEAPLPEEIPNNQEVESSAESETEQSEEVPASSAPVEDSPPPSSSAPKPEEPAPTPELPAESSTEPTTKTNVTLWGGWVHAVWDGTTGELKIQGGTITNTGTFGAVNRSSVRRIVFEGDVNVSGSMSLSSLFWSFPNLVAIQNLEKLNTSAVTNMSHMFSMSPNLTSLDLSSFDTSSVTDMSSMFQNTSSLTSLDLSSFDIDTTTNINSMFLNTSSLRELKLGAGISHLNGSGLPTISTTSGEFTGFWRNVGTGTVDRPNGTNILSSADLMQNFNPSMADTFVWQKTLPRLWGDVEYDYDETSKTLTLEGGTITDPTDFDNILRSEVEHIVFEGEVNVGGSMSLRGLFDGFQNLVAIQNLEKLNTSGVTDMSWMFWAANSLTSLDLSSFDTSSVTDMRAMFVGTESLTSLDLSSFDTSSVTDMSTMFGLTGLKSIDLSSFNTSSVKDMSEMFAGSSLTSLDLTPFDTSSVTDMSVMFTWAENLTEIDLSSFDTSSVTDMAAMFGMTGLKSLDLSSFNTPSVTNLSEMFFGSSNLTSLDLSSFDTSSVTNMRAMFTGASSLTSLDLSSFDTSAVENDQLRISFNDLNALVELRLGNNTAIDTRGLPALTTTAGYLHWWAREGEPNNWLDSHQLMDLSATSGQAAGTWRRVPYQTKVEVKDSTLSVGDTWQAKDNFIQAINREGDEVPFEDVTVTGKVDTTKAGIYEVTYAYDGVSATAKVTVKAEEENGNGNGNGNGNNNSGENENGQDKDDSTSNNEKDEDKASDSDDTREDEKQSQQEEQDLKAASRDKLPETGEIAGMLSWLGLGSLAVAMLLWYKRRRKK